jgi:membrane protease YdiL (CAAX protease family)
MGLGLKLLLRWLAPGPAILASAVCWGILHSLQIPVWGLAIWWPFLIFSTLFVVWQQRGFWTGVAVASATHFLQNIGPSLALAYPNAFHALS